MENIYHEEDKIILIHVVEQLHLPFLAGMKTIAVVVSHNVQSWTKVLGQICTFGAFGHTPDTNTTSAA